jgi:hypothetical protein
MKKLILLLVLLLFAFASQAQEEETEDIPYLQLGSNFAVPALPAWEHVVEGETALFTNRDLEAQIYVAAHDSQDIVAMLPVAIAKIYQGELPAPIYSNRIAPNNGTWEYRLYDIEDMSVSAYGMLKSNRVYTVVFVENSAEYEAYQLAIRSSVADAAGQAIRQVLDEASLRAIESLYPESFEANQLSVETSYPAEGTETWLLSDYENGPATAAYLNDNIIYVTLVEGDSSLAPELSNAFDTVFLGFVITPNNSEYLYLGMAFAGSIMLILVGSMWLRYRSLQKDLQTLEQLAE